MAHRNYREYARLTEPDPQAPFYRAKRTWVNHVWGNASAYIGLKGAVSVAWAVVDGHTFGAATLAGLTVGALGSRFTAWGFGRLVERKDAHWYDFALARVKPDEPYVDQSFLQDMAQPAGPDEEALKRSEVFASELEREQVQPCPLKACQLGSACPLAGASDHAVNGGVKSEAKDVDGEADGGQPESHHGLDFAGVTEDVPTWVAPTPPVRTCDSCGGSGVDLVQDNGICASCQRSWPNRPVKARGDTKPVNMNAGRVPWLVRKYVQLLHFELGCLKRNAANLAIYRRKLLDKHEGLFKKDGVRYEDATPEVVAAILELVFVPSDAMLLWRQRVLESPEVRDRVRWYDATRPKDT